MLRKYKLAVLPVALAVVALAGCPNSDDNRSAGDRTADQADSRDRNTYGDENRGGGGGGRTANQVDAQDQNTKSNAERAGEQVGLRFGSNLTGDKRHLAEALARTAWVQANVAAHEWDQAGEDLAVVEDRVQDLAKGDAVPAALKGKIASLPGAISQLGRQILAHDPAALVGASALVDQVSGLMNDPAVVAWMGSASTAKAPAPAGDRVGVVAPADVSKLRVAYKAKTWVPLEGVEAVAFGEEQLVRVGVDQGHTLFALKSNAPVGGGGGGAAMAMERIYVRQADGRFVAMRWEDAETAP